MENFRSGRILVNSSLTFTKSYWMLTTWLICIRSKSTSALILVRAASLLGIENNKTLVVNHAQKIRVAELVRRRGNRFLECHGLAMSIFKFSLPKPLNLCLESDPLFFLSRMLSELGNVWLKCNEDPFWEMTLWVGGIVLWLVLAARAPPCRAYS